jgi:hypothetical protein
MLLWASVLNAFAQSANRAAGEHPAIWEPPSIVEFPSSVKPTVVREMITSLKVSGLRIVLEDTKLKAAEKRLGGTIGHRGDAGDSLDWLCLHGTGARGDWVLWLMSGEIDAGSVGGVRWQRVGRVAKIDAKCQMLAEGRRDVELPAALRLGIGEAAVLHALGEPSKRLDNALLYLHEREKTIHNQPYTATNTIAILLRGGAVWAIEVWKSTTS